MHNDELDFKCPICFAVFNDTQLLCQHIVSHNSGEEQTNQPEVTDSTGIMQSLLSEESSSKFNEGNGCTLRVAVNSLTKQFNEGNG